MEAFVSAKEPLATDVDFDLLLFSDPAYSMDFKNVPLDKMDQIEGDESSNDKSTNIWSMYLQIIWWKP